MKMSCDSATKNIDVSATEDDTENEIKEALSGNEEEPDEPIISQDDPPTPDASISSHEATPETSKKRAASEDETWLTHPYVEDLLLEQVAKMDELDDISDLSTNPLFKVSPKRQKTPDGYLQKIESAYDDAVKTVGNKTIMKNSAAYVKYNNSFDPRINFEGIIPKNYIEPQLEEGIAKTAKTNFLLHVQQGADLFEQHMARYQVYLAGLANTPAIEIKSTKRKTPKKVTNLSPKDDHETIAYLQLKRSPEPALKDDSIRDMRLLWCLSPPGPMDTSGLTPTPPGPVSRPMRSWQNYRAPVIQDTPLKSPPFPDTSPGALVTSPPLGPVRGPFWSPSINDSEEESDSPKQYPPVFSRGINVEQLMAAYVKPENSGHRTSSQFWDEAGGRGKRRLWDDNDLMVTGRCGDDFHISPGNTPLKKSYSDPDFQRHLLLAQGNIFADKYNKDNKNERLKVAMSDKGLNPMSSEFIPAGANQRMSYASAIGTDGEIRVDGKKQEDSFEILKTDFPEIPGSTNTPSATTPLPPDKPLWSQKAADLDYMKGRAEDEPPWGGGPVIDGLTSPDKPLWVGGPGLDEGAAPKSANAEESPGKKTLTYAQIAKPPGSATSTGGAQCSQETIEESNDTEATEDKDEKTDVGQTSPYDTTKGRKYADIKSAAISWYSKHKRQMPTDVPATHSSPSKTSTVSNKFSTSKDTFLTELATSRQRAPPGPPPGSVWSLPNINPSGHMSVAAGPHMNHAQQQQQNLQQRQMQQLGLVHDTLPKPGMGQHQMPVQMMPGQPPLHPHLCFQPMDQQMFRLPPQQNLPPINQNQMFLPSTGPNPMTMNQPPFNVISQGQLMNHVNNHHLIHGPGYPNVNHPNFPVGMKPPQEGFLPGISHQAFVQVPNRMPPSHIAFNRAGFPGQPPMAYNPPPVGPPPPHPPPGPPPVGHGKLIRPVVIQDAQTMKKIEVGQLMQEILAASGNNGKSKPQCQPPRPPGNTNSNCSAGETTPSTSTATDHNAWKELASLTERFKANHPNAK